ncbi:hypothetical protein BH09ACT8_BH09ACT8_41970 [soil metagenome]
MSSAGVLLFGAALFVTSGVTACGADDTTEVSPTRVEAQSTAAPVIAAAPSSPSEPSGSSGEFHMPAFGVEPTTRTPLPPNADTCPVDAAGNVTFGAKVADPAAPQLVVGVPAGFLPSVGDGDVAVTMPGPDGMSATVTIAVTELAPEAAFEQYSDKLTAGKEFSSVSVLPGDLCGYSGQKLMGSLGDKPGQTVEFRDRIVHIWTNTKNYLVAIRLQGPTKVAGFDAAESVLMADFGIVIP